ncbi:Starch-binding associating with outer membrane [Sinomicrobium oceani]|uniref:Starch-binding associating with outer membrane n=1 Tax=Sinomicrobium oceani TaxID=1150368 RepID=A0A1K1NHB2_9FLAO|nr:SusD/RagB family nutrient-binding outer membrane lipoprotein [Sinomicrobium oceani]SFW33790.1 Starch-binding associating with outer membrane [Sinomicrobium oceani]
MKSIYKKAALGSALLLLLHTACTGDFDEINTNPDGITSGSPETLASQVILNITREDIASNFMGQHMYSKYILWSEFPRNEQYNRFSRTDFNKMSRLVDADKMVEYAESTEGLGEGIVNSYRALRHFVRAVNFFNMSIEVGDIPYSDALKGESESNLRPLYDTQKEVFAGILDELDEADALFAAGEDFTGDMIYEGNVGQWRKAVNAFELKVLLYLYKKTADTDLRVRERFADIVANRPLIQGNEDNFELNYVNAANQMYPFYKLGNQSVIYPMVSSVIIDKLKEFEDFRLFYYAAPSPVAIEGGADVSDYDAYKGTDPSMPYADMQSIHATDDYSDINDRYKEIPEGEPVFIMSYAQVQFMLAEGNIRGWISGNAESFYREGIRAAMSFVAENTPERAAFNHGRLMDADYIDNYYDNTPAVQFAGTFEAQLEQIITQKYICTFMQAPREGFYENRRTGYPEFPVNPATNENIPSDRLPVRWLYPQNELDYNSTHLNEAIDRQYSGNDNVNELMWILQ